MSLLGSGCAGKARQDWAAANGGEAGIQAIVMQEEARAHLISTKQGSTYPVGRLSIPFTNVSTEKLVLLLVSLAFYAAQPRCCSIAKLGVNRSIPLISMPLRKGSAAADTIQRAPLRVPVPPAFDLGLAVSSYGFFMLPPNQWVKVHSLCVLVSHMTGHILLRPGLTSLPPYTG